MYKAETEPRKSISSSVPLELIVFTPTVETFEPNPTVMDFRSRNFDETKPCEEEPGYAHSARDARQRPPGGGVKLTPKTNPGFQVAGKTRVSMSKGKGKVYQIVKQLRLQQRRQIEKPQIVQHLHRENPL